MKTPKVIVIGHEGMGKTIAHEIAIAKRNIDIIHDQKGLEIHHSSPIVPTPDEVVSDWHNTLRKTMPLSAPVFALMDIQIRANDDKHFIKKYCAGPRNTRTKNPRRARRIVRRFNKATNRGYGLSNGLCLTFGRLCAQIAKAIH